MIVENLTMHVAHGLFLALTPTERWNAARSPHDGYFALEQWFTPLMVAAQIISLVVVFGLIAKKRNLERKYEKEIDRLSASNERLSLQVDELTEQALAKASEEQEEPSDVLEETEAPVAVQ